MTQVSSKPFDVLNYRTCKKAMHVMSLGTFGHDLEKILTNILFYYISYKIL
jgi:hypothetical protein